MITPSARARLHRRASFWSRGSHRKRASGISRRRGDELDGEENGDALGGEQADEDEHLRGTGRGDGASAEQDSDESPGQRDQPDRAGLSSAGTRASPAASRATSTTASRGIIPRQSAASYSPRRPRSSSNMRCPASVVAVMAPPSRGCRDGQHARRLERHGLRPHHQAQHGHRAGRDRHRGPRWDIEVRNLRAEVAPAVNVTMTPSLAHPAAARPPGSRHASAPERRLAAWSRCLVRQYD